MLPVFKSFIALEKHQSNALYLAKERLVKSKLYENY